jgi:putative transposase
LLGSLQFKEALAKKERKRKHDQRSLSKKKKGSKNWIRAKAKVAKVAKVAKDYYKEKQFRKDYLEKASTKIAKGFALVAVEDLKLKNMTKSAKGTVEKPGTHVAAKSGLNREMLRLGLGYFLLRLEQKCTKFGGQFVRVNPKYTSQTCCECGYKHKLNRKNQSDFVCLECGFELNADINAAYNILDRALA